MEKMNKKLLIIISAFLAVILSLSACGQQRQPSVTLMEPAAYHDSEIDEAIRIIKIGFIGPISGSVASEGTAARNAFQMAVDEANRSGRFPYYIETVIIDDKSDADTAEAGARRLVSEPGLIAVTGFWNSGPAAAAIPIFIEAEIPLLIWGAIRENLTNEYNVPWITRSAPTDKQENIPLAKTVLDEMGYRDWFVISDTSAYGAGNYEAFIRELFLRGITPLGTELVPEDTENFDGIVRRIILSGAKAVYCGSTHGIGAQLKLALYETGVTDILFCGISGMKTNEFLSIGNPAAEGTLVVSPGIILSETEIGHRFIERYNANGFSEPIAVYTPYAYEATLILLNALSVCGKEPTAAEMADAIFRSRTIGIMGTTSFNEIGQTVNVAAYLNVAQDGVWIPFQNSEYANGLRRFGGGIN
jgi:branched-chain amino acid transport system substrate-binding protein